MWSCKTRCPLVYSVSACNLVMTGYVNKSIKGRFCVEDSICNISCITTYVWLSWGFANCGRPGEQHSLILRPISQPWKNSTVGDTGLQNGLFQDVQKPGQIQMRTFDNQELDSSAYAILVSCHCTHTGELALVILANTVQAVYEWYACLISNSGRLEAWIASCFLEFILDFILYFTIWLSSSYNLHVVTFYRGVRLWVSLHSQEQGINWILTEFVVVSLTWIRCFLIEESRLHFKHSLSWCPRPPRDLLLSVALENFSPLKLPNEALPQLTPQVV